MAHNVEPIVKRNSKLETFLKRNLDVDTFEKIRAHDPCIVCSEKEDKAFKFVILSDEWLYLTENPPKKLYETVNLKDLISIDLINDFPEFLQGEEREHTQHLVIRYKTDNSAKAPKSGRKEKKQDKDGHERSASPSPTLGMPQNNPIIMPYGRKSFSARDTKEQRLLTARQILAESRACHTSREASVHDLTDTGSKHVQFGGTSSEPGTSRNMTNGSSLLRPISPILKRSSSPSRPESPGLSLIESKQNGKKNGKRHSDTDSVGSRPLPSPRSSTGGSRITPRTKGELRIDLSHLGGSSGEEDYDAFTDDDEDELNSTRSSSSKYSGPKVIVSDTSSQGGDSDETGIMSMGTAREATLHIYIMSRTSKILMLTKTAWHNYILRRTLEEDPNFVIKTTVIAPKSAQPTSEKLEVLFRQLKTEMQYSTNTMEDIFYRIHELKVAADRNFALRKLFWKTSEVFLFMIHQLRKYIPMTPIRFKQCHVETEIKVLRADELEYLNLILETLALLLRETEIVPTRVHMMKSEAGRPAQDLINQLLAIPEIPESTKNVAARIGGLHDTGNLAEYEAEDDIEIIRLVDEYKDTATKVLFELLMIGEQAAWCNNESSLLNASWIIKGCYKTENVEVFVEHMITKSMAIISPRRTDIVSPSEAVLLYHQYHILKTLVDFNDNIITFIQNNFYEEFKYYVQGPVLQKKLPSTYLLRPYIYKLMENVLSKVLEKTVKLSSDYDS